MLDILFICRGIGYKYANVQFSDDLIEKRHGHLIAGKTTQEIYNLKDIGSKIKQIDDKIAKLGFFEKRSHRGVALEDKVMKITEGETSSDFEKRTKRILRLA
uniref:Uncharacterized protein n=1 Tax=Megaviridae environmental sample TaxID=1737588 RepID=A0A5J6VJK2_9VIRU|nr:MAG: hypothetical protein [Megaviridae environmental sample]